MTSALHALSALLRSCEEKGRSYAEGEFKDHPEQYVFHDHHWHSRISSFAAAGAGGAMDKPLVADLPPDHPIAQVLPGHAHRLIGVTPPKSGLFSGLPERYVLTGQVDFQQGQRQYTLPTSVPLNRKSYGPRDETTLAGELTADPVGAFYNALEATRPLGGQVPPIQLEHEGEMRRFNPISLIGDGTSLIAQDEADPARQLILHAPPMTAASPTWQPFSGEELSRLAQLGADNPNEIHAALNPIPRDQYAQLYRDGVTPLRRSGQGVPLMDTPQTSADGVPAHALHPSLLHIAMSGRGYYDVDKMQRGLLSAYQHAITSPAIDALERIAQHQATDAGLSPLTAGHLGHISPQEAPEAYNRVAAAVENLENAGLVGHGTWKAVAELHGQHKQTAAASIEDARLYTDSHLGGEPSTAPTSDATSYAETLAEKVRQGQPALNRKDMTWKLTEGHYWPEAAAGIPNPHEMWHGTDVEGAKGIVQTGFRVSPDLEANGRAFGDGVYLSRHFEKSAQYPFHEPHGAMLRVVYPGDDMHHLDSPEAVEGLIRKLYAVPGAAQYRQRLKNVHDQMAPLGYAGVAHTICPQSPEEVQHVLRAGIKGISYPARYGAADTLLMTSNAPRHALLSGGQALAGYPSPPKAPTSQELWVQPRPTHFQGQEAVWYGDPKELKITAHLIGKKGEFIE